MDVRSKIKCQLPASLILLTDTLPLNVGCSGSCKYWLSAVEEPVWDWCQFAVHPRAWIVTVQRHVLDLTTSAGQ